MAKYRAVHSLSSVDAAYSGGLVDGEGTITLSRKHANENRQLVISISSTERSILEFALRQIGAGKITSKRIAKAHHAPSFYLGLTPRNGKYTPAVAAARRRFEEDLLALRANSLSEPVSESEAAGSLASTT